MPHKSSRKKELNRLRNELKDMETLERVVNALGDEGNRPFYEEDVDLDYWRRKMRIKKRIQKLQGEETQERKRN